MSGFADLGDTARLNLVGTPVEYRSPSPDDTADLRIGGPADTPDLRPVEAQLRRFAAGIIGFYRARTILSRGASDALSGLAWSYLERIEPVQLPAVARPAFFDLAYFMRVEGFEDGLDHAGFRRRVLDVAVIIDGYLDDMFTGAGS